MAQKTRKPAVSPEKRMEWLERLDKGETPPKIAAADGFDARTVRKYLDQARQEREVRDARSGVLRTALERHYADLCRSAQRLVETPSKKTLGFDIPAGTPDESAQYDSQLRAALKQHLPKSHLWKLLAQRSRLTTEIGNLTKAFENKIKAEVPTDRHLINELGPEESRVIPGMVTAFIHQLEFWITGCATLNVEDGLKATPVDDEMVDLKYGAFSLGKVRKDHVELIGDAITEWTRRFRESEELRNLEKLSGEVDRLEEQLREEVAVIALRRVVPGRCRFCPL